ncbi:hypothetical protein Q9Q94_01380 [Uliginosibacterium sp. 31-16]|uniref:hypothetical protein n=1 Tax=Uliginosibacterium sp. 31-16 TaxID=3068315 RepID=UPI00273F3E84|nr:hypothetical protein [Uliginosibacterium sp. 31-16]MDP5238159.1 hypothetical protein [Uliginosibacterium sp. 31-16]
MKTNLREARSAAGKMAGSLPKLFVSMAGILGAALVFSAFMVGQGVAAQGPDVASDDLDAELMLRILHRNSVSTIWPQALHVVLDK